jgi:hypothetical protein
MKRLTRRGALFALLAFAAMETKAGDPEAETHPEWSGNVTGYYYAMRDQPDFGVGVAALNRGPLHLEARYNYEVHDAGSVFLGWNFSGGDSLTFQVTPIIGALLGDARGVVPGFEASVGWRTLDAYIEAEYVHDTKNASDSYYYAWTELGWKPVEWLRVGIAAQRTRVVHTDRDLQRGLFAQVMFGKATLGVYAFNPDEASRYAIVAFGVQF